MDTTSMTIATGRSLMGLHAIRLGRLFGPADRTPGQAGARAVIRIRRTLNSLSRYLTRARDAAPDQDGDKTSSAKASKD